MKTITKHVKNLSKRLIPHWTIMHIGVREFYWGGRKKIALKITICPKTRQLP